MSEKSPQIPNAITQPNLLLGGAPTPEHLRDAVAQGYKAFVDIRSEGEAGVQEARATLAQHDVSYTHIPVSGAAGLTRENAQALDTALASTPDPVMVFCASGNRVGALLALRAHWLHGATGEEALKLGIAAGLTKLEAHVRQELGL